jgi:hypothetical protein
MTGHVVRFFATRNDHLAMLREATAGRSLHFFPAGVFDDQPAPFDDAAQIPVLGMARKGDQVHEDRYLVLPAAEPVQRREIHLNVGGTRIAIDQLANPKSVIFCAGGEWDGGSTIISGDVGTVSDDPSGKALWLAFAKPIKKKWRRVKAYYVGPEALAVLRGGGRLTTSIRSPALYDLAE